MMESGIYPHGVNSARVILVIEIKSAKGGGRDGQPSRIATEYWSLEGEKLAEYDPYLRGIASANSNVSQISI